MKPMECNPAPIESAARFLSTLDLVVDDHERKQADGRLNPGEASAIRAVTPLFPAPATIVGRLVGFTAAGVPLVALPGGANSEPLAADTTVALTPGQIGSQVVLCFAGGDQRQSIILGCLVAPVVPQTEATAAAATKPVYELNDRRLEFTAQDEIVLRCGKASITLTQAGKVLIRGEYLLSRSAGVNRIKGGSVQIN
jgi:Domain of unknown function (DUF6484)